MNWWNTFTDWLSSSDGSRIVTDAILPFVAILLAGLIATLVSRAMISRLLELRDREVKAVAVTSLIGSARRAIDWSDLGGEERSHATHLADEAGVRLRLLPVAGSGMAASWAEHEIQAIRGNSATFRFQAEQTFSDVRDRLVEWQAKPARAKKLFRTDLERWKAEGDTTVQSADAAGAAPIATHESVTPDKSAPASAQASPPAQVSASVSSPAQASQVDEASIDRETPTGTAVAAPAPTSSPTPAPLDATEPLDAPAAPAAITRQQTGMVTPPVVQPSGSLAPASPSDAADTEARDDDDREAAYSAPVSAQQVRRRTSPDPVEK